MTAAARSRLRARLRRLRRALDGRAQRQAARSVAARIARMPAWRRACTIGAYLADDGELDPAPLLLAHASRRRQVFLPRLPGRRGAGGMRFGAGRQRELPAAARFRRGRWRRGARRPWRPAWRLDIVLLPLVAFDRNGTRLGRGGGHYDRALAPRPGRPRPVCIGLAHAFQEVAGLEPEAWDVRVDAVATPDALFHPQSSRGSVADGRSQGDAHGAPGAAAAGARTDGG
jgi:5-formyltetrahydrofolate cyclo-ligase